MALDLVAFDALLKDLYDDNEVARITLSNHPLMAWLPRSMRFGGRRKPIPIIYGNPQGRSAVFATAQANQSTSQQVDFLLTRVSDYAVSAIDGETIDASDEDIGAFVEAKTTEIDGAFEAIAQSMSTALYRNGTGSIGRVGSGETTKTVTLLNTEDIVHFEVGMTLVASATDGGAAKAGTEVVEAVDRDLGTIDATSATWDAVITTIAANDWFSVQGDLNAKISGLDAWLPATVTATLFFGVDRTADSTRLGGVRYNGAGDPPEEAYKKGLLKVTKWGGRVTDVFTHFERWSDLETALGSKVQYETVMSEAGIGFESIVLKGPWGKARVMPDVNCQDTIAFGLNRDHVKLHTLKGAPRFLVRDGAGETLRQPTADGEEFRIGYYANLACNAPGRHVRITLP